MYLRFVVLRLDETSQVEQGVFMAMDDLRDSNGLYPYEVELEAEIFKWFNKNLKVPNEITDKYGFGTRAISWFKCDAHEYIDRMRSFVQILDNHGYKVKQITTDRPGKIVYEDDYQIAAKPFKDTF